MSQSKKKPFRVEDKIQVKPEILSSQEHRNQVIKRTGFNEIILKSSTFSVAEVHNDGNITIKHSSTKKKPVIHSKFFQHVTAESAAA